MATKAPRTRRSRNPGTVDEPGNDAAAAELLRQAAGEPGGEPPSRPQAQAEEADERDAIDQLRAEAGNGAYVRIYRRCLGDTEFSVQGRMELSEYSLERVQEIYGGGEYQIKVHVVREGKHVMVRVVRYTISHSIPSKHPLAAKPADPATPGGTDLVALVKQLQESQGGRPGGDNTMMATVLTALITSQGQLMQAMLKKEAPADNGTSAVLLKMLEMERERANRHTPHSELLETFKVIKQLTGGKGGGDDDDEPKSTLDKLLDRVTDPRVVEAVARAFTGGGNSRPRRLVPVGPGQPAAAEEAEPAGPAEVAPIPPVNGHGAPAAAAAPAEELMFEKMIQNKINDLVTEAISAAKAGEDPKEFAGWLLDEVPGSYYDKLEALAKGDNWFAQIFGAQPHADAVANKEWLTKMRDALLEELKEEAK